MRILFISGLTGFASGGVNTEIIRLLGGLRDRGCDIGFAIDRLPQPIADLRHFPIHYPPDAEFGAKINAAVTDFKPDCVHLIGGGLNCLRPLNEMGLAMPWMFTAHNLPPFEQISNYFLGHDRLHYLVRNARAFPATLLWKRLLRTGSFSRVIAHSQTVARHLREYGCPADKIAMIPFGCEAPPAATTPVADPFPAGAYPKILTIAGYAHHKGVHDYLAAITKLITRYPKLAYRVIGNSRTRHYTEYLQNRIAKLKLENHVGLLRSAGDDVKQAALSLADLYVQPSHEEGFCLSFAEAAMVVPRLIGCRAGEIEGLAGNGPEVRVIEPKNVAALIAATGQVLTVDVSAEQISNRAANLQNKYSWSSYMDLHEKLFTSQRPAHVIENALPRVGG
jgi:glycosyltransferase involved in cell wall biosynthesis